MDLTPEDKISDEAVRAAAEAIEDETFRRIGPGRDLDDIHRDDIVRAGLLAALPLLGTAWPEDRVECADCGRTSGYCKCGDIDAAEMARLMRERVLRESTQDECSGYEDFVAVGPDEVVLPLVTAAAAEKIAEARYRAGREAAARDIEVFGERARGRAQKYAGELSICSRRSNDAVVDTYMKSASLARSGDVRNVQCSNCRDTRGGPIGHETGECTWKPCNTAHQPRTPSGCDGEDSPEERTDG